MTPTRRRMMDASGVSTVTGYIMTFFIATLILGITIISNQALVSGYGNEVARRALETIGNNIALRITQVDRIVASAAGSASDLATINTTLTLIPLTVGGQGYSISFANDSLTLEASGSSTTQVQIPLNITTPMAAKTLYSTSGQMLMYYNAATGLLDFR